jgi:poly(3-hydroxyoctanoate) depolymerase
VLASTSVGLGGVPGHPLALALLATPLRYYSPSFFRRTARLLYGPLDADGDGDLLQAQTNARRAPTADDVGVREPAARGSRPDEPPLAAPDPRAGAGPLGRADPIVPPVNARILAARLAHAELAVRSPNGKVVEVPALAVVPVSGADRWRARRDSNPQLSDP